MDISQVNVGGNFNQILSTVDAMQVRLTKAINAAFNVIFLVRKIAVRNKEKPWFKPDLFTLIKQRDHNFKASSLGIPALVAKFIMFRSQVISLID